MKRRGGANKNRGLKKKQMIAREYFDQFPREYDEEIEIWHAIFSVKELTKKFTNDIERLCKKHDIRMVLTKQKKKKKPAEPENEC